MRHLWWWGMRHLWWWKCVFGMKRSLLFIGKLGLGLPWSCWCQDHGDHKPVDIIRLPPVHELPWLLMSSCCHLSRSRATVGSLICTGQFSWFPVLVMITQNAHKTIICVEDRQESLRILSQNLFPNLRDVRHFSFGVRL